MNNTKILVINLIKSFFVTFAWMNIGNLESTSILLLCVFGVSYLVLSNENVFVSEIKKNERVSSLILGALFVVMYAFYADLTGGLENKLFIAVYVICTVLGLFVMFSSLLFIFISKACSLCVKKNLTDRQFSVKVFLIYTAIVFACCMPFFLLNYPGVMTTDSLNQFYQVIGDSAYNNHHPWLHTALIKLFYSLGYVFTKDMYAGLACYTLFQMFIVSVSVGYSTECFYEMGVSRICCVGLIGIFVIIPYNLMYSVTMWKDITFSMAVLVFTVTVIRINANASRRDLILFLVSGFAVCVLRHNGYYAFIATVVIWLYIRRKQLKKYILASLAVIIVAGLCRGPVMEACGVLPGEYVYNMCLPLQQIGRVIANNGDISVEEEQWLTKINTIKYIKAGYNEGTVDPMFAWVLDGDSAYFDSHKREFIKIWAGIGIKNPIAYFDAFVDMAMGYWTPMKPYQTVYFGITPNDKIESKPVIDGPVLIKIDELLTKFYEMIPIYGFTYSMGGYFWIMLILGVICIDKKEWTKLFAFLPVLMLTLTLLIASPLVADLRYAYALMIVLPYLLIYTLTINSESQEGEENVSTDIC